MAAALHHSGAGHTVMGFIYGDQTQDVSGYTQKPLEIYQNVSLLLTDVRNLTLANQTGTSRKPGWYPLQDQFGSVPYHSHVLIGSFMIIVFLLALGGHVTVIFVIMRSRKLRTPSNTLVLNLAAADLLMALCGFPLLIVSSFYGRWIFEPWVCDFYGSTSGGFGLMSINTLVFISLDRYVAIVRPEHITRLTASNVRYCIIVIWVYSFLWALMPVVGWNRYIFEGYGTACSFDHFTREQPHSSFLLSLVLADYVLPSSLIVCFYVLIFRNVKSSSISFQPLLSNKYIRRGSRWRQSTTMMFRGSVEPSGKSTKQKYKWTQKEFTVARRMLVVLLFYFMAWTPYAVVALISQYGDLTLITPTVSMLPAVFAKISTVYNPFIYALTHPNFKLELKKILTKVLPASIVACCPVLQKPMSRVVGPVREGQDPRTRSLLASSTTASTPLGILTTTKLGTLGVIPKLTIQEIPNYIPEEPEPLPEERHTGREVVVGPSGEEVVPKLTNLTLPGLIIQRGSAGS